MNWNQNLFASKGFSNKELNFYNYYDHMDA